MTVLRPWLAVLRLVSSSVVGCGRPWFAVLRPWISAWRTKRQHFRYRHALSRLQWESDYLRESCLTPGRSLTPLPVNNMLEHERRLGRRGETVHVCATCGGNGRRKCARCLHTYYCTPVCQERDWRRHNTTCIPMESSLQEYLAIAVPDFRYFFQYQDALARSANSEEDVGICIMSLGKVQSCSAKR